MNARRAPRNLARARKAIVNPTRKRPTTGWAILAAALALAAMSGCKQTTQNAYYTVTYSGNSAASGSVPKDSHSYENGGTATVLTNTGALAKSGYYFYGWNTADDGSGTTYLAGDSLSVGSADVTLYAYWKAVTTKTWTVLVYMDADNSLASYAANNIKQMEEVGSDDNINIVLLYDSTDSSTHGYYYVQSGKLVCLKDTGELDMASTSTAESFVDYAATNFPASKYMLVYWDHGDAVDYYSTSSAASRGVCWDDSSASSSEHLSEVNQKAIGEYAVAKFGQKLEVIGFDACLMATAEIAYQYKGIAKYLAASEQSEPANGWDWTALQTIKTTPSADGATLAKAICSAYASQYSFSSSTDWTFSAMDLADYADTIGKDIGTFASAARASITSDSTKAAAFKSLAASLPNFDGYTKDLEAYMGAIVDDGSNMDSSVVSGASTVVADIGKLVIANEVGSTWTDKAYGCSITLKTATSTYDDLDLCADTEWDEFCTAAGFPSYYTSGS